MFGNPIEAHCRFEKSIWGHNSPECNESQKRGEGRPQTSFPYPAGPQAETVISQRGSEIAHYRRAGTSAQNPGTALLNSGDNTHKSRPEPIDRHLVFIYGYHQTNDHQDDFTSRRDCRRLQTRMLLNNKNVGR
jgi:hypothetical protein